MRAKLDEARLFEKACPIAQDGSGRGTGGGSRGCVPRLLRRAAVANLHPDRFVDQFEQPVPPGADLRRLLLDVFAPYVAVDLERRHALRSRRRAGRRRRFPRAGGDRPLLLGDT